MQGGEDVVGDRVDLRRLLWIILCIHCGGRCLIRSNTWLICLPKGQPPPGHDDTREVVHPSSRVHGVLL